MLAKLLGFGSMLQEYVEVVSVLSTEKLSWLSLSICHTWRVHNLEGKYCLVQMVHMYTMCL